MLSIRLICLLMLLFTFVADSYAAVIPLPEYFPNIRICNGDTEGALNGNKDKRSAYNRFFEMYANCTHIIGNLIINELANKDDDNNVLDYSFLKSIVEVNGIVSISGNTMRSIPLTNLRVIRGFMDYCKKECTDYGTALHIGYNHKKVPGDEPYLAEVDLRSLQSILHNNVSIGSNFGLCFIPNTINWTYIVQDPTKQKVSIQSRRFNEDFCKRYVQSLNITGVEYRGRNQKSCHESCPLVNGRRYCWGPSKDQCQKIVDCDRSKCENGLCFLERAYDRKRKLHMLVDRCCNVECAAGCTGLRATHCLACRNFLNGKECVRECPKRTYYDKVRYREVINKNARFTYGSLCVKACPKFALLADSSHCVASCNLRTHFLVDGNKCTKCFGDKCDYNCIMEDMMKTIDVPSRIPFTPRTLLNKLKNCRTVEGNLKIFDGTYWVKYKRNRKYAHEVIRVQDLENLRNIRTFLGKIYIDFNATNLTSLSFLSNLTTLRSHNGGFQLSRTPVVYLGLRSLKHVVVEKFYLLYNNRLCFLENFRQHFEAGKMMGRFHLSTNRNQSACKADGLVCHAQCDPKRGCWGPGPTMCVQCRWRRAGDRCVRACSEVEGYFTNDTSPDCVKCHSLCQKNCTGPTPNDCRGQCRVASVDGTCVAACPSDMYKNEAKKCLPCSGDCSPLSGHPLCTGPNSHLGPGACNHCSGVLVSNSSTPVIQRCLKTERLAGHYSRAYNDLPGAMEKFDKTVIAYIPCDPLCKECSSDGHRDCTCRYFVENDVCVRNCSNNTHGVMQSKKMKEKFCLSCSPTCQGGCTGPLPSDCKACKNVKIFMDKKREKFYCAATCPKDRPYTASGANSESICSKEPSSAGMRSILVACIVPSVAVFFIVLFILIFCLQRRRTLAKKNLELQTARYRRQLHEEMIPLKETDKMPNSQVLRIIGADQLKKGLEIGSGAFGTVFVGIWRPPKEKPTDEQVEIKVAIKTLKESGDGQSAVLTNEFLSEAHVMATVDHPFCISLLGVSLTSQMQLISDFMPLGSLVDYLPKHRHELGSQQLLTWAVQIAKGMVYLETQGIIHRDLAARNVLLESTQQVRITDFGLAKLMDEDGQFFAEGGRFPVKWLAMECLRCRIFSHKSDVWAFGVTLWEIFTFGQRPYSDVRASELIDFLDRGERLLQPDICTLDIYMLMIKCWLVDPDGRPTFEELVTELSKMAADPARYLVVPNDNALRVGTHRSNSAVSNTSLGRHRSPNFPRHSRSATPEGPGGRGAAGGPGANPSVSSNDDSGVRKPPVRVALPQPGLSHLADEVARRNAETRGSHRPNSTDLRYAVLPSTGDEGDVFEDYLTPTEGTSDYLIPNQMESDSLAPRASPENEYYNDVRASDSPAVAYVNAPHLVPVLSPDDDAGDYLSSQQLSGRDPNARRSPEYRVAGPIHDYYNTGALMTPQSRIEDFAEDPDPDDQADYLLPMRSNGIGNARYTNVAPKKGEKGGARYLPLVSSKITSPPKEVV